MNKNRPLFRNRQKKYELLFQRLTTAFVFHKTARDKTRRLVDLTIFDVNDAFETISGFKKKELIGKTLQELLPHWSEQIDSYVRDLNQQGEILIEEPGSLTRWYLFRSFCPDKDCLVTSFEDITTQKKTEAFLKKTNRSLFALIGSLPGFAYRCLYNKDWTMLYLSDECEKLTGYRPEDLVSNHIISYEELILPQDRQYVRDKISAAVNENRPFTLEYRIVDRHGAEKWVWERGSCYQENDTSPLILEGFVNNITDRKQSEIRLKQSEETLRGIFDAMSSGVILVDKSGRIIFSNKRMTDLFGYTMDNHMGKGYAELTHGSESPEARKKMFQLIRGDIDLVSLERLYQRSDGSTFSGQISGRRLSNPDGSFWALVGVITDISEQKKTQEALIRSEVLHRTLVNTIPDLIWLKDENGVYLSCNKSFELFFGAKESDILGKTDYDFVGKDLADFFRDHDKKAIAAGRPSMNEEELTFAVTGYHGLFETIKTPMHDHAGNLIGVLGISRDITERQMAEKALKINEERYRDLFDNMTSGVAVYTVKEDGNKFLIKDFNRAAEQITGVKREDVTGKNALDIFPGLEDAGIIKAFRHAYHTSKAVHLPAVFYQDNHLVIWVRHNIYKLPSGEIVSVFNDITDEKQTKDKLQAEREKIESIINGIGDSLYIINNDYKIRFQNDLCRKDFGNLIDKICYQSIFNRDNPCEFCLMPESLHENKIKHVDIDNINQKNFEITFSPFQEVLGSKKIVVVLRDTTDKKILQAEAMRAGHLASLGELAAGVAHEINNPVTGIISIAEILSDKFEQLGGDKKIPERIIHEGERISRIVKNLLSFARAKNGDRSSVQINLVLEMAFDLVEKQIFKDGIHLKIDLMPDLPKIRANDQEIQQVFLNIISNARYSLNQKYPNPDENKKLEISTRMIEVDQTVFVRIAFLDFGIGIPGNVLNSITDPFFSTKPQGEGTGLGLSISHGIIKAHGGRLLFKSVEGEYAKAMVDLPVEPGLLTTEEPSWT